MAKKTAGFIHIKLLTAIFIVGIIAAITLVTLNHLKVIEIGNSVYAQNENNKDKNSTVEYQRYLNGKVKMKNEVIKDSKTGKMISETYTQYDKNGHKTDKEEYIYDINTGIRTCIIYEKYDENEKIIQKNEFFFDSKTSIMTKKTQTAYRQGKISYIREFGYSPESEMPISSIDTDYDYNGCIFSKEEEYWDAKTHKKTHRIFTMYSLQDGSIKSKDEYKYDPETGEIIK